MTPHGSSWLAANPRAKKGLAFGRDQQFVINPNGIPDSATMLKQCPATSRRRSIALPALAERLGLGEIRVKDESQRFGFGAFKALGGVLAVYSELSSAVGSAYHTARPSPTDEGQAQGVTASFVFTTASSGNHGRSVAAGAKLFGNRCVVFLPKFTSRPKRKRRSARAAPR